MIDLAETWLPVVGYEGLYEVSDQGRVRSVDRVVAALTKSGGPGQRQFRGKILSGSESVRPPARRLVPGWQGGW